MFVNKEEVLKFQPTVITLLEDGTFIKQFKNNPLCIKNINMSKNEINSFLLGGFILVLCHVVVLGLILIIVGIYGSVNYK